MAQTVKRLHTMRETLVQSQGQEDLLEKEMATHSSTLAWKILWTEEPGRLQLKNDRSGGHKGNRLLMATHSSVLAWRIPGTAEPGGLPSMGSHRVGHD